MHTYILNTYSGIQTHNKYIYMHTYVYIYICTLKRRAPLMSTFSGNLRLPVTCAQVSCRALFIEIWLRR